VQPLEVLGVAEMGAHLLVATDQPILVVAAVDAEMAIILVAAAAGLGCLLFAINFNRRATSWHISH
jgi:hypothetical protein